jgi:phage gp36-like protein
MPYATQTDLERHGYPAGVLSGLDSPTIEAALERASQDADGALRGAGYRTPLATWSVDLTGAVVAIAAWYLMCRRGFDPESAHDAVFRVRFEDAQKWLSEIANRRRAVALCTEPPVPVPAPAEVAASGASIVHTTSRRGW